MLIIGSGLSYYNFREMRGTDGIEPSRRFAVSLQQTLVEANRNERTERLLHWEQAPSPAPPTRWDHLIP